LQYLSNQEQIVSGNYFHQYNDGDGDGDKMCGDAVGMVGMLFHPHVTLQSVLTNFLSCVMHWNCCTVIFPFLTFSSFLIHWPMLLSFACFLLSWLITDKQIDRLTHISAELLISIVETNWH